MGLSLKTLSRTDVLQRVAEDERFAQAKSNKAFVMMNNWVTSVATRTRMATRSG